MSSAEDEGNHRGLHVLLEGIEYLMKYVPRGESETVLDRMVQKCRGDSAADRIGDGGRCDFEDRTSEKNKRPTSRLRGGLLLAPEFLKSKEVKPFGISALSVKRKARRAFNAGARIEEADRRLELDSSDQVSLAMRSSFRRDLEDEETRHA